MAFVCGESNCNCSYTSVKRLYNHYCRKHPNIKRCADLCDEANRTAWAKAHPKKQPITVDGQTYHEFMSAKHAELKATIPNSRDRMRMIGQLWREAKSNTTPKEHVQVDEYCPYVIVYESETFESVVIQHEDEEEVEDDNNENVDNIEVCESDEQEDNDDCDEEDDDDDDEYYNSIDILVAKLTTVNKIDSLVYKWITGKLQRKFIDEQEFMDGIHNIYETHNQHALKQHIPSDIYQYYSKYMKPH